MDDFNIDGIDVNSYIDDLDRNEAMYASDTDIPTPSSKSEPSEADLRDDESEEEEAKESGKETSDQDIVTEEDSGKSTETEDEPEIEPVAPKPVYDEYSKSFDKDTMDKYIVFASRYLNLMAQKRAIDYDVKSLKQEYAEEGIAPNVAIRSLNHLKKDIRSTSEDKRTFNNVVDVYKNNKKIMDAISDLT